MSVMSVSHQRNSIDLAIKALCPIIQERVNRNPPLTWTEFDLRKELVGCVLGSQVRHEMAAVATANLEKAGLLKDQWWVPERMDDFGPMAFEVLSGRLPGLTLKGRYRFPKIRAQQLTEVRNILSITPLMQRLKNSNNPFDIRRTLISEIPGLGPKQASMFLRNIGLTYDMAILDVHVLRFLKLQELLASEKTNIGTLKTYERVERKIMIYATAMGYPAGYLDWAIWATMKAAQEVWQ